MHVQSCILSDANLLFFLPFSLPSQLSSFLKLPNSWFWSHLQLSRDRIEITWRWVKRQEVNYNQKCQQDRNNLHAFYTGLSNMRHKFNKLCTVRYLLMLTSLTGILNLVYLMFLADIKGNVELYTSQRFSPVVVGRQIASVQVDSEPKVVAGSSLSYLELLNLELKDIVQRYMTSSSTISKHYEVNNLRDSKLPQQEYVYGSFVPRCSPTPFLLILVHSSPFNFMDRESIRLSWGREDNPINQGSWTHSGR